MTAVTERPEQPLLTEYENVGCHVADFVQACLWGNQGEAQRLSYVFAPLFSPHLSLASKPGQTLFHNFLWWLLVAGGESRNRMISLWPAYEKSPPDCIKVVGTALRHPDCPPVLLSFAARHTLGYFRQAAASNPACPEEDQVYAALMGSETR